MATPFVISFEQVQLIEGLNDDQPVWLYLRGTLFDDSNPNLPLEVHEVGSLPPDANRPSDPSYPKGDAGLYAAGLPRKVEVRNDADNGASRFRLPAIEVAPGQSLEVQVVMLPRVWFKQVEVSRDDLEVYIGGVFLLTVGAAHSGLVALGTAAILGLFHDEGPETTLAPCMQTVITARHLFSYVDLVDMQSQGMVRFGPRDNDLSSICGLIDSFYWLMVGAEVRYPSFGSPLKPASGACELRPLAHEPPRSWLEGRWSDTGNFLTCCLSATVIMEDENTATVHVHHGRFNEGHSAVFEHLPIELEIPSPPFARNFYDDACPARSVSPACVDCRAFSNLPLSQVVPKEFLMVCLLENAHRGATRLLVPESSMAADVRRGVELPRRASKMTRRRPEPPKRISRSLMATALDDRRVELTPVGNPPMHMFNHVTADAKQRFTEFDLMKVLGAYMLKLNDTEALYTYGEIHNGKPCIGRLRYVKASSNGEILADVLMMPTARAVN